MEGKESLRDICRQYPGLYTEFLPIDLDNSSDLPKVWEETKALCSLLQSKGVKHHVYFSGNKGFHVLIPTEVLRLCPYTDNEILKRMATRRRRSHLLDVQSTTSHESSVPQTRTTKKEMRTK